MHDVRDDDNDNDMQHAIFVGATTADDRRLTANDWRCDFRP